MKRSVILSILLVLCVFFLAGCELAILGAQLGLGAGIDAMDKKTAWDTTTNVYQYDFKVVWNVSQSALKELGLEITEAKLNEQQNGGVITAKSDSYKKVAVGVETKVSELTGIYVRSEKTDQIINSDKDFSVKVSNLIEKRLKNHSGETGINKKAKNPEAKIEGKRAPYLVAAKVCNVRKGPSTATEVVATVAAGTRLERIAENGDWYNVRFNGGQNGYVFKSLVSEGE